MTETDNGFLIVHTPQQPPVRSRTIRSLQFIDPVWVVGELSAPDTTLLHAQVENDQQRKVIQSVWEKLYDRFTAHNDWIFEMEDGCIRQLKSHVTRFQPWI